MEADQEQPEVPFPQNLVVHPAAHLREPVVKGSEECKKNASHDDVMKMRDHKIGSAELPIERRRAQHDSRQASDQELEQKAIAEKHRSSELNLPAPHRPQPIEDLNSSGNADGHRGDREKAVCVRIHPDCEHVVSPDTE